jgi:triosephosphate isomerase
MTNRQKRVFGNWKMNHTFPELQQFIKDLQSFTLIPGIQVGLFPSFPYIHHLSSILTEVSVGAQNFYPSENGAFTGEVSVIQIKDAGAKMALIGHSERRFIFHENNEFLKQKVDVALSAGVMPVFCCGEPLEVRNKNEELSYVRKQLDESLFHLSKVNLTKCVIAYEPVWAIGTGLSATSEQAEFMHKHIRSWIAERYDIETAERISILYGGSCNSSNAKELFACPNVDGGLIGGASLKADSFHSIITSF